MLKDRPNLHHLTAGFIAVLVGYTSSAAIIFQAARAGGADAAVLASWMFALGIGMGVASIGLSLAWRQPLFAAWSTPGAALLVTGLPGVPLEQATGAFVCSSALIVLAAATGLFRRLMQWIPASLGAAMLAGVLLPFGTDVFRALLADPVLVGLMMLSYLGLRRASSRFTMAGVLLVAVLWSAMTGTLDPHQLAWAVATPVFTRPVFDAATLVSIGIPLFVVTMAAQNVPGIAVLRAHGYEPPVSQAIGWTGALGLLLAPFGAFALNLAAISAAICMGPDVDPDPRRRYWASVAGGVFYLLLGLFGAAISGLFLAFPQPLILAIAGLALLGTIGNSMQAELHDPLEREAAVVTFLVAASGLSLAGIGAAFWALVAGLLVRMALARRPA